MALQEFCFVVKHRPGTANTNADALSRLPQQPRDSSGTLTPPPSPIPIFATTMIPGYNLQQAQLDDPYLSKVINFMLDNMPKPPYFVWGREKMLRPFWHCWEDLHVVNGLLVKRLCADQSLPQYAFVIPEHLVQSVMQGLHCSPFSGHLGIQRTLQRAKERYFWPHMNNELQNFVRHCQVCAQANLDPNHQKAPLQIVNVNEPFVFWAMDYMGPLPETTQGNKHLLVVIEITSLSGANCFPPKIKELRL